MALNSALITSAYTFATSTDPRAALRPGWIAANSFGALTPREDVPELRRQLMAVRHVFPTSLSGLVPA